MTPTKSEISAAAGILGHCGGSVTGGAKARAARENGKLGGWPKGRKRGPKKVVVNA